MMALLIPASSQAVQAAIRMRESGARWGLVFTHHHGDSGVFYMNESMGSGVAVLDYDGDGDRDVFFVDSGPHPGQQLPQAGSRLFQNQGKGTFTDVTMSTGITVSGYGMGVTAGDVDGDADLDLYVTAFGANQLFRNNGDGTFTDVTARAGVGEPRWSASAAFGDVDGDGDLDLYVTNYVDFTYDNNPFCGLQERQIRSYCHPEVYNGVSDRLYRNRGDGSFVDATADLGVSTAEGKGLGVIFSDLDDDGHLDIYVANDMTPNFFFRNRGDGTFEEEALLAGVAVSDLGNMESGMGIETGDLDGDGHRDIFVTHLDMQSNAVYRSMGKGLFMDARHATGLAEPSLSLVGFGTVLADFDQDGDQDLAVGNGHIIHNVELFGSGRTFKQLNQLLENRGGKFFEVADSGLRIVRATRGLASGDLDGDGDLDLVALNIGDVSEVDENVSSDQGSWIGVDLRGAQGNSFAIGAALTLVTDQRRQTREVRTASSYMSQNDITVHFGSGAAETAELLIRWPGGRQQRFETLLSNRRYCIAAP